MSSGKRKHTVDEDVADAGPTAEDNPAATTEVRPAKSDAYYRNLYKSEPDFRVLGKQDADFAAILKPDAQLDFSDPAAVMQLTKTLLKLDFGLKIELPPDRLCPPVLNRHNYILWLKGLLDTTSYGKPGRRVVGLDIGTGASCIYPLLGCAQRDQWYFVATDIDEKNLQYARRNIHLNNLQQRIRLLAREPSDPLLPLDDLGLDTLDFAMTNPPFYASAADQLASAARKARAPSSACTGAPVEMVTAGGELAFVGRLLAESRALRGRVRWCSAMVGKAATAEALVGRLREGPDPVGNFAVAEFVQGSRTRRWAVAWSFGGMRPAQDVGRAVVAAPWRRLLPPAVDCRVFASEAAGGEAGSGAARLAARVREVVGGLELVSWDWDGEKAAGVGRARGNVWGRAWRRKRAREGAGGAEIGSGGCCRGDEANGQDDDDEEGSCAFGFLVAVHVTQTDVTATVRWLEGHDQALFESFTGFLKGKLKN